MNPGLVVVIAVAGGVGASARYMLDSVITHRTTTSIPIGTLVINVTGSLVLGLVAGLSLDHVISAEWQTVAATGFLGGYTTFSTASTQTFDLFDKKKPVAALVYSGGMFLGSLGAAACGMLAARLV